MNKELLYCIPAGQYGKEGVLSLLTQHPEIRFVSLVGIDLAGNDTDEKIPIEIFMKDYEDFFAGKAVQTDGSSVVFMNIATLNDARVDMVADSTVNWYVDYNDENISDENGRPVGTLRIPCFLIHNGKFIDSRSVLKKSCEYVSEKLKKLLSDAQVKGMENFPFSEIQDIVFTTGTELEFWVKTPSEKETVQHLSISQRLQEQYWQRMRGNVRTAMEQAIEELDARGMRVEMGHKEVGGIKPKIDDDGHIFDVCEQLELDWLFSTNPLQAADNELEAVGYGFIMGILNNYEATNPFVSSTTDAFNRLKPGFEAPVCIVTSLGHSPEVPSRNRSILMGLIRDTENPKATRFELRAPNPFTNTYMAVSCLYMTALDGIEYAVNSGKGPDELLAELSKTAGEDADYLSKDREYRCEKNVFEDYDQEQRDAVFGKPPATVWENVRIMRANPDKVASITRDDVISKDIVESFIASILYRWKNELIDRIIPGTEAAVKGYKKLDNDDKLDEKRWKAIKAARIELAKDTEEEKCICTRLNEALEDGDYDTASDLQIEMAKKSQALEKEYRIYALNILD